MTFLRARHTLACQDWVICLCTRFTIPSIGSKLLVVRPSIGATGREPLGRIDIYQGCHSVPKPVGKTGFDRSHPHPRQFSSCRFAFLRKAGTRPCTCGSRAPTKPLSTGNINSIISHCRYLMPYSIPDVCLHNIETCRHTCISRKQSRSESYNTTFHLLVTLSYQMVVSRPSTNIKIIMPCTVPKLPELRSPHLHIIHKK